MSTEILPYRRLKGLTKNSERSKVKNFLGFLFTRSNIILIPIAFLMGRASLVAGLMPFGIALYASTLGFEVSRLLIAASIILGMISSGAREQVYIAAASMLLFNAINIPFRKKKSRLNFRYSVIAFVSVLIPETVFVALQGFLTYDILKALLHSFIVFTLMFLFRNALPVFNTENRKHVYSNEEIISVAIISALALSGLTDIQFFGFTLKNVLCILVILLFSYKFGPGVGAAVGVTIGLIVSMSTSITPMVIGTYAFCGLLSGVFRNLGKVGAGLGFVMGNAVLTLYMNGSTEVLIYLKEIVLAVGVFLFIPQKIIDMIAGTFSRNIDNCVDKRSYSLRIKEITVDKLQKFSKAFRELSKTFNEISETHIVTDKQDISVMFDRVADKVCKDCSLCLHCWDRNFYNTYQVLFKIVEKLDTKGRVEENDVPKYFLERCERINDFVQAVNTVYEIFKVDLVWKSKVGESRGLVSQQLEGLSKIISNLAADIDVDIHFKRDLEDTILMELNRGGVKVSEVIAFENKWGKYEISIFHKECGGKRECIGAIEKLISEIVGRKMVKENSDCHYEYKNKMCNLKLIEEEAFRVTTGVAKLSKYDGMISGDNYTFMSTGDGKFIVALSDGMGSGQKAAIQSRATISLLEQFMESGFDQDTTVKLINSILVLKSSNDSFATIDMSVIDLFDGVVEFVKIGAVPTVLKREERIEVIKSVTLPAGIMSNIEMELLSKKIESGELIIMMTDGIVDSFKKEQDSEKPLLKFIQEIDSINPQEIADTILSEAYNNYKGTPMDDMLVLVAKVWKRTG